MADKGSNAGGRMVVGEPAGAAPLTPMLAGGALAPAGGALARVGPTGELRVEGTAANGSGGGRLGGASKWPQVTQKRKVRGFRWPQSGQGASCGGPPAAVDPGAVVASLSRSRGPTKWTSGAGGRCGINEGGRGGCDARASMRAGAPGATCPAAGSERPVIGVAGAPREASL